MNTKDSDCFLTTAYSPKASESVHAFYLSQGPAVTILNTEK